jgi:hypothetical protein
MHPVKGTASGNGPDTVDCVVVRERNCPYPAFAGKGNNFKGRITSVRGVGVDMKIDIHMLR